MAGIEAQRRLVFVKAQDLDAWRCRPLGAIDVLDLKDEHVGHLDGLLFDAKADRPLFLVIRRTPAKSEHWFLLPVGDAWFDQTMRAIRIDVKPRAGRAPEFNPERFAKMSHEEAEAFERHVLAECCPEVGLHRDGTPDYSRATAFECPAWLRPPALTPGF
jgi:hypothetical protein